MEQPRSGGHLAAGAWGVEDKVRLVDRPIVAFRQDEAGAWVAELACGYSQHIRHNPPFRLAPWVLDDVERNKRIGGDIECRLCDQAEPS